jgi:hypothetical protein
MLGRSSIHESCRTYYWGEDGSHVAWHEVSNSSLLIFVSRSGTARLFCYLPAFGVDVFFKNNPLLFKRLNSILKPIYAYE